MKLGYISYLLCNSLSLIDIQKANPPLSLGDMTLEQIEQEIQDLSDTRAMLLRGLARNRALDAEIDEGITQVSAELFHAEQSELRAFKRAYQ
jgi:hypothetical protein